MNTRMNISSLLVTIAAAALFLSAPSPALATGGGTSAEANVSDLLTRLVQKKVEPYANGIRSLGNGSLRKLFKDDAFAAPLKSYPLGSLVGGFIWRPGMGTRFTGPVSGNKDFAPFTSYIPLAKGPVLDKKKTYRIAFVYSGANQPWLVSLADSAVWEADRHPNVKLTVKDAQFKPANYIHIIDSFVNQHYDAIIIWPPRRAPMVPAVNRARAAGIPVITVDRRVASKRVSSAITGNFLANGLQQGLYLNFVTKGKASLILNRKTKGSTADFIRTGAFLATIGNEPYDYLNSYHVGDSREVSYNSTKRALITYPHVRAIFNGGGEEALGALSAVEQAHLKPTTGLGSDKNGVILLADDDSRQVLDAVAAGKIAMDSPYTPFLGDIGVRVAVWWIGYKDGLRKDKPPKVILTPNLPMITQKPMVIDGIHTVTPAQWPYAYGH